MSLADIASSFGYFVNAVNSEYLAQPFFRSAYDLPMSVEDLNHGVTVTDMLMWELEGQMKRLRQESREKSASASSVDYDWLKDKHDITIPRRLKLDLENLCKKIKPTKTNIVLKRFRDKLQGIRVPDAEELPLLFSSVLRTAVAEQVNEENQRVAENTSGIAGRVWQRLQRSTKVGVISDVESGQKEQHEDFSTDSHRWAFRSEKALASPPGAPHNQEDIADDSIVFQQHGAGGAAYSVTRTNVQVDDLDLTELEDVV